MHATIQHIWTQVLSSMVGRVYDQLTTPGDRPLVFMQKKKALRTTKRELQVWSITKYETSRQHSRPCSDRLLLRRNKE